MYLERYHMNPNLDLSIHFNIAVPYLIEADVSEVITWAMSPLRLLRAWWKRLMKRARNCLRISFHPVITVEPLPFTLATLFESSTDRTQLACCVVWCWCIMQKGGTFGNAEAQCISYFWPKLPSAIGLVGYCVPEIWRKTYNVHR